MGNPAEPSVIGGADLDVAVNEANGGAANPSFHGRTVSWVAVAIIVAGFLVGGIAMIVGHGGPLWWLFWVAAGLSAVGLLMMLATKTFEDWY